MSIDFSEEQLWNALSQIVLTDNGIDNLDNNEHPIKDSGPIIFKDEGSLKIISVNDVQLPKAIQFIPNTDEGIKIFFKDEQEKNINDGISWIDSGSSMSSNEMQFLKIHSPSSITEEGIVIHFNDVQYSKADSLIIVTDDGIITSVNNEQL